MTLEQFNSRSQIEHLRAMVANFNSCAESFNQKFSVTQLYKIYRAWMLCAWDIAPDNWTPRQVREATQGKVPQFDTNEKPVYSP